MFKNLFTKIYLKIRVTGEKIHNILFKVNHMKEQISWLQQAWIFTRQKKEKILFQ